MDTKHQPHAAMHAVYDTESFRTIGQELIELLADHLDAVQQQAKPVLSYRSPEEELAFWKEDFKTEASTEMLSFFRTILARSISVHHPHYMGHQVSVPALIGSLSGLVSDVLSNGTAVYEMGMASNAIEKVVTDFVNKQLGYDTTSGGFLTSGGTLANLTALLAARSAKAPTAVWENGHTDQLAVLVSEEAHYCIDRAARIMGLGTQGIIKIPVDDQFQMQTSMLESKLEEAKQQGLHVIALIGCASSTATGAYDDLTALAAFAKQHNIWLHVDGAHGGGVIFSEKYAHLAQGIEQADSVVIDFHKMLLTPALTTALVFKNHKNAYATFQQKAQYLWNAQESTEWYNSGKRTFECTKLMMGMKVYSILKMHGKEVFGKNVTYLYDIAKTFATQLQDHPDFELLTFPQANIVNFRFINCDSTKIDYINDLIHEHIIAEGQFYIVQTTVQSKRFLRVAIMNPLTKAADFTTLLAHIITIYKTSIQA